MRDVISQGADREPAPRRRRAIAAGLAAAVVIAIAVTHWPRHPPARPRPAPSAGVIGPDGITGPSRAWDAALRLPVTGQQPALLSPGTGRRRPIGGLPRSRDGYEFTRVGSGWAIQPAGSGAAPRAVCDGCAGSPRPVYFLPQRDGSATVIARADAVAPAASSRAMWLTTYSRGVSLQQASGTARQVSVAGGALGLAARLPAGYMIVRGTDQGLLLAPVASLSGARDELWDPVSRRAAVSGLPSLVLAASAGAVAMARCGSACQVVIVSLAAGGRAVTVPLPAGSSVASAVFSPDGTYLALQVNSGAGGDDGGLATRLEVAVTATGALMPVPQTSLSSDALIRFGWPPGGDRLVAELAFTTKTQLASWTPGAARLAVAALRPGSGGSGVVVG